MIVRSFAVILVIMAHAFFTAGVSAQTCCCYELGGQEWCQGEQLFCGFCPGGSSQECDDFAHVYLGRSQAVQVSVGNLLAQTPQPCYLVFHCNKCVNLACEFDEGDPIGASAEQFPKNVLGGTCP